MFGRKHNVHVLFSVIILIIHPLKSLHADQDGFDEPWRFTCFTTSSGLPSNLVYSVDETPSGTIWASTSRGVAYYDGYRWTPIDLTKGLPQKSPMGVCIGDNDSIFFIVDKNVYYGTTSGFRRLPFSGAWNIAPFGDHRYLMHLNSSLYIYDHDSLTLYEQPLKIVAGNVVSLIHSHSENIWVNTYNGLFRYDDGKWNLILPPALPALSTFIAENKNGTGVLSISVPYNRQGLWMWDSHQPPRHLANIPEGGMKSFDVGPNGELLILLRSGEIRFRRGNRWSILSYLPMKIYDIEVIRFRDNGDIWFCTGGEGLYLYNRSSNRWRTIKHNQHTALNIVNEILRTHDSSLWIGTESGIEIVKTDGTTKIIEKAAGVPLKIITGLEEDQDNNVWVSSGATFDGAIRWDGKSWKYFPISKEPFGLRIHKIRKDAKGRLWFLGMSNTEASKNGYQPGAFMYDGKKFTRWGKEEGLLDGRVQAFAEGHDGARWFGTYRGLSRFKNGKWRHWTIYHGTPFEHIFTMAVDYTNRLWFADRLNGLGYITDDDSVHKLTVEDGLPSDIIWDIRTDPNGRIWFSTQDGSGLWCYTDADWMTFDSKTGLPTSLLWPVLPFANEVYIGTFGEGVVILNLSELTRPSPRINFDIPVVEQDRVKLQWDSFSFWGEIPPTDILTRYRIDDQQWSNWSTARRMLVDHIRPGSHFVTVLAQGMFGRVDTAGQLANFIVTAPFYQRPGFTLPVYGSALLVIILFIQYLVRRKKDSAALRLSEMKFRRLSEATFEGIIIYDGGIIRDVNWSISRILGYEPEEFIGKSIQDFLAPESRESFNTHMNSESEYPVEVVALTKDGERLFVEIIGKSLSYQGRLVKVAAIRDIRERKRAEEKLLSYQEQLRNLALELASSGEKERQRMAVYLHDEIIQSLAFCQIKLSELKKRQTPSERAGFLSEVNALIEQSIENAQSMTFELSPPVLHLLGITEALEWLVENFQEQHQLQITLIDDGKKKTFDEGTRVILFNAVREALVNIVKHAQAKHVTIESKITGHAVQITVKDDGLGFNTSMNNNQKKRQGGFGLFSMRERLSHLGGNCIVDSHPGTGTTVTLIVPAPLQETGKEKI